MEYVMMNATEVLQVHLDNAGLRKEMVNITGKFNETAKELAEVKLRHAFEMDEIKLTYEDKAENIQRCNTELQREVEKYQNKVLALHELMSEKEELVVEMKRKLQECQQHMKTQKAENEKKIQSLKSDIKAIQMENKNIKTQCQALEQSNAKLTESLEKSEAELANADKESRMSSKRSSIISSIEMSDNQLQSELNELHTLLKEKSKTIREIKKRRTGNWNQYGKDIDKKSYIYKLSTLETEIKTVQSENETLKNYCEDMETSKFRLLDKINMLEEFQINEEKLREEIEELRNLAKEKEETITWIETKMLESFDSMANKTNEYEDKITSLETQIAKLQLENRGLKMKDLVDCTENMDEMLLKPIDVTSEIEMMPPSPISITSDAPSKLKVRGGLKRIFSRSFRKFIRERGHVKDRGINDDNEMFYVSEKD